MIRLTRVGALFTPAICAGLSGALGRHVLARDRVGSPAFHKRLYWIRAVPSGGNEVHVGGVAWGR